MSAWYLETSALVKLFVREAGTDAMLRLASTSDAPAFALLSITRVELASALHRRARQGDLREEDVELLLGRLHRQLGTRFVVQPANDAVLDESLRILRRNPLRAYDALQLAGALVHREGLVADRGGGCVFVSSDAELLDAAAQEGVETYDPTSNRQASGKPAGAAVLTTLEGTCGSRLRASPCRRRGS